MSDNRYTLLLSLHVEHGFYNDGMTDELVVAPNNECGMLFQKVGLIARQENGRLQLYGKNTCLPFLTELVAEQSVKERKQSCLDFIICGNNTLMSVTKHMSASSNAMLCCSNLPADKASDYYLAPNKTNTLRPVALSKLSPKVSGLYQHRPDRNLLAVIRLHLPSLVSLLNKQQDASPFRFFIEGIARPWVYLVTSQQHSKFSIVDTDNRHQFAHLGREVLGSRQFESFISNKEIALQQRYEKNFQLKRVNTQTSKSDELKLPGASPHYFRLQNINGEQTAVSEIMVSLT